MVFWLSIFISFLCILKTKPTRQINRWDILFFLSSWQIFNLGIWQDYLTEAQISNSYEVSSVICSLLVIFYLIRREIKINLKISIKAAKEWLMWVGILLAILLPIGFSIGFLHWNPKIQTDFLKKTFLDYFLFVAVVEELIWRSLVQNLLKRLFSPEFAIAIATLMFATIYSHIAGGGIFPNWKYVGMALLAGAAYGISYHRTNNILVPILIHGTVDSIWRIFFS